MIRLHIIAEGQTEVRFIEENLIEHLGFYEIVTDVCAVTTKFDKRAGKKHKGGLISYNQARRDISKWLKSDKSPECRFTTMFDFYGIPKDFPGYKRLTYSMSSEEKVRLLEQEVYDDINDSRFIPYLQLHEFEALLFTDPSMFEREYPESKEKIIELINISDSFMPEEINDNPQTAPSKRIKRIIPAYEKVYAGPSIAKHIGLVNIREKCPHFNKWLTKLESLGQQVF